MHRYPKDTIASIADFRRCGWRAAIDSAPAEGYSGLWSGLSNAAREAAGGGDAARTKVLWLLADACSMRLKPQARAAPFLPYAVFNGTRSAIPEDLGIEALQLFAEALPEVDDPWLRARLADLLWVLRIPRDSDHARIAIDAYRSIPLDQETWLRGGRECWQRAISLTLALGAGAGNRLDEMEEVIVSELLSERAMTGYLQLWLSQLLDDTGFRGDRARVVANTLEQTARLAENQDLHRARQYFHAAAEFFRRAGEAAASTSSLVAVAECWANEGVARQSGSAPSHMAAASCFEKAIQTYRTVPRAQRPAYGVDERIANLRQLLSEAGERTLGELSVLTSESIDISDLVEQSRNSVRGKPMMEALASFVRVATPYQVGQLRESAERSLEQFPLQTLFERTHYSRDGRVVARTAGTAFDNRDSDDYRQAVHAQMIQEFTLGIGIRVQGAIWPALQALTMEHRLRESDLVDLARISPVVPPGRERLVGKSLFFGFEGEFAAALHLLVPQFEAIVRFHLKAAGSRTTTLNQSGIENEVGLSALVEVPEMRSVFGEDLTFEITALFCDALGLNIRNEVAHGLMDDAVIMAVPPIYAWWLLLKIVYLPFWNAGRRALASEEPTDKEIECD
jgi:hypothetical protein